jgi:hypothetical protein
MRARNLKPSLFRNELLAVEDPLYTLVFEGLWCLADRSGRLEDRPAKIHLEINPGRAFDGTTRSLEWLAVNGFIERYESGGTKYIQVVNFSKHQNPHCKEPASTIPAPDSHSASPVQAGLIPDSGLLTPDSPNRASAQSVELHASLPTDAWDEWIEFRRTKRWPCDATTLKKQLNLLAKHSTDVQREMLDTSINSGWQGVFAPKPTGKPQPPPKRERPPTDAEIAEARRRAAADNASAMQKLGLGGVLKGMPQ